MHDIENKIKQLKLANQKLNRNSRAGSGAMYETVEETRIAGGGQTAKVEETVLFAREVVGNSVTTAHSQISIGLLVMTLMAVTRLFY